MRIHNLPTVAAIAVMVGQSAMLQSAIRNPKSAIRNDASAWRTLFDGKSLDAWRGYKSQTMPAGWRIEAGALVKDDRVPDIITKDQYGDFELELEWKIGDAGNSGIFYRGIEDPDYKGAPNNDRIYTTGPEYQLLDDIKGADNKTRLTCAAAAYGLYPSPAGHLKPVGQWNKTRIVARGAQGSASGGFGGRRGGFAHPVRRPQHRARVAPRPRQCRDRAVSGARHLFDSQLLGAVWCGACERDGELLEEHRACGRDVDDGGNPAAVAVLNRDETTDLRVSERRRSTGGQEIRSFETLFS